MGGWIRRLPPRAGICVALCAALGWPISSDAQDVTGSHIILPPAYGATPLSTVIQAEASYIAGKADLVQSAAIARRIHAEAYALELQNAVEEIKVYFERRQLYRDYVRNQIGDAPDVMRERTEKAMKQLIERDFPFVLKQADPSTELNWLLTKLYGPTMAVQYMVGSDAFPELNARLPEDAKQQIWLTDGGPAGSRLEFRLSEGKVLETAWPPGLRREAFTPLRLEFEAARDQLMKDVKASGQVTDPTRDRVIVALDRLLVALDEVYPSEERSTPAVFLEYNAAKSYLRSLVSQVNRALSTNDRSVFAGSLKFKGDTVSELVQHMYQSGIVFAPPKPGSERVYANLIQTLRNVYMKLLTERPAAAANPAEARTSPPAERKRE
jgi:hypothetical protein